MASGTAGWAVREAEPGPASPGARKPDARRWGVARLLSRVGAYSAHHRLRVVSVWLALLVAAVAGTAISGAETSNDFRIPGTESQEALDVLAEKFPVYAGTSAHVVFVAPAGATVTTDAARNAIAGALVAARSAPQVVGVVDPAASGTVSADNRVAIAQVRYSVTFGELEDGATDALIASVETAEQSGLTVLVGGNAFNSTGGHVSIKELLGVAVALIILLLVYGSLLSAGMTMLAALVGVAVSIAGLLSLTKIITLSSTAPILALMIGLAVGIDYGLFILSRHRAQLADGMAVSESIARSTGAAGSAVVFAGLTVVIAMAGLSIANIPFLTVMGLSAAGTVVTAVAITVTLLPALMGLSGERLRPRQLSPATSPGHGAARRAFSERWVARAVARPVLTVVLVVAVLGAVAVPALSLNLALPDTSTASLDSEQRQAYDEIARSFAPGFNSPLLILVEPTGAQDLQQAASDVAAAVQALPDVVAAVPALNSAGDLAVVQLVPISGAHDEATLTLVRTIRARSAELGAQTGTVLSVTGTTAAAIDVSDRLRSALFPFACVVVGLSLLLLLLVFRSVVIPLKATAGFLLSVGVAFGVVVAVFQWGWSGDLLGVHTTGPVASFLPIVVLAVLFGLSMDYEVFLVSRMHEEHLRTGDPHSSILAGARHAGRIVIAAALIMFAVFACFVTSEDATVKPIAIALAVGVLIDAFLIRMTLVPAVLALAGAGAWWIPAWLDRLMPWIDIEGESLASPLPTAVPATHTEHLHSDV